MAKINANANWIVLATFPNSKPKPHEISVNTANLSTQGTVDGSLIETLRLVQKNNTKITVLNKPVFLQVCNNENINYKAFNSVINFKN